MTTQGGRSLITLLTILNLVMGLVNTLPEILGDTLEMRLSTAPVADLVGTCTDATTQTAPQLLV
jgi:hypothetical protein